VNKFIVVELHQPDREYVEDVEFIDSFESYERAQQFILGIYDISRERVDQRHKYIEEFVKTLPEVYQGLGSLGNIEDFITFNKKCGKDFELLKDFNPPDYLPVRDLRIVEIE